MSEASNKQNTHLKWILPLVILSIAIATFFILKMNKPKAASRVVAEKVWSVRTIKAQPGDHQPALILYGKVESPRMSNVTAAVTAFVRDVFTDEGRSIEAGELLIQLDDSDVQLTIQQRQADVDNLLAQIETEKIRNKTDLKALNIEKNLRQLSYKTVKRYENLIKRKLTSQEKLDAARRDYQQQALSLTQREQAIADHPNRIQQLESQLLRATSLLNAAQLELSRTKITAPFVGRIANLSVAPGDRVRAGDPLIELYSLDRLEVRAQIPNRILPLLRNRTSEAPITAYGQINGQTVKLKLDRIAAEVGNGRGGVDALFNIHGTQNLPEPGRSMEISVNLPSIDNAIPIPPTALYGLDRVYRVTDNRLEAVQVKRIGDSTTPDGKPIVLIASPDIRALDHLVITQLPNAITGLSVKDLSATTTPKDLMDDK